MKTVLAVSPHLDDALFSAAGTLWHLSRSGNRVLVATVFTGSVEAPSGFALACQLDKGLPASVDYMALRRREDERACAMVGATPLHLPFLEAPHRGYGSARDLFGPLLARDAGTSISVTRHLAGLCAALRPELVLAPSAIGGHVDHELVRDAVLAACAGLPVVWWEDWPYCDRDAARCSNATALEFLMSPAARSAKADACAAYASQVGFQFGSEHDMRARLRTQPSERLHRAPAGSAPIGDGPRCRAALLP